MMRVLRYTIPAVLAISGAVLGISNDFRPDGTAATSTVAAILFFLAAVAWLLIEFGRLLGTPHRRSTEDPDRRTQ